MFLKNKKVLLAGLGILGGGFATANFLLKDGANLTITDKKNRKELEPILKKLKKRKKIKFILGEHRIEDFKNNDVIIFNPAVSVLSPWVRLAKKYKKQIENDFTLFLNFLEKEKKSDYIAVTGTRGKTTTATWINHFLENSVLGGNMPELGLLKIIAKNKNLFVLEISSFQLEFMRKNLKAPKVALITNLYVDHLNRHKTLKNYLRMKSKIFLNQTENDFLVLNADNKYTKDFLKFKPKSKIYYFSINLLPAREDGLFLRGKNIYFQENGRKKFICAVFDMPIHQKYNLLASLLASYLFKKRWSILVGRIKKLPSVPFRQEIVFNNGKLKIINDTAATSPDATIAALKRFSGENKELVLVTGGTDKNLVFADLAKKIRRYIHPQNLFLLEGSATIKLINELKKINFFNKGVEQIFNTLKDILTNIFKKKKSGIILFSPASASFEKFKNEFDRGKEFNNLVKNIFKKNGK